MNYTNGYFNPYLSNFQNNINNQPTQQSNLNWIDVNNINEINNITVQPNTTAWIKFINDPIIATKTSDSMGICTTKYFKIEEIQMDTQQSKNTDEFVTKKDFEKFLNDFNAKFDSLTKQNNNNKNK